MSLAARLRRHWPLLIYALLLALAAGLRFGALTQLPHTLWVDEAWFGLQGRVVLSGADLLPLRPPAIGVGDSAYQIYAAALAQAVGVPAAYSSRFASAVTGLLLVAATYPVLRALARSLTTERAAAAAALLGTALVTVNFAALLNSRGGQQMSGAALATVLTAGGLYQTFRRPGWRWPVLTGLVVGLGQTTYEAALALPVLVTVYTGVRWVWPGTWARRQVLLRGGVILATALAAFSPLLLFYYYHPGIYLAHVGQTQAVAGGTGLAASLSRAMYGLVQVVGGVSIQGDRLPGRNIVERPLFDWAASALLWLGLVWVAGRAHRRPAAQLLLAWAGVLLLPSALSDNAPAFSRMLPLVPVLAGLAGLGAAAVGQWAAARGNGGRWTAGTAVAAAVLLSAGLSLRAYFVSWPAQPGVFDALHFGARLTAEAAIAYTPAADVFVMPGSTSMVAGPFELLLDPTPVQRFDAAGCYPYADRSPRPTVYTVIQVMDDRSLPLLQSAYPSGSVVEAVMHPDGYAYALFLRVPAGAPAPSPDHRVSVEFANGLQLVGYTAAGGAAPGQALTLQLFWRAAAPIAAASGFVHIGQGPASDPMAAQQDGPVCPDFTPDRWAPGYVYVETRALTIAPAAPPGAYDIRVGAYDLASQTRYAILAANVPVENNRAVLGEVAVR